MLKTNNETQNHFFSGPSGCLPIKFDDKAAIKLAMLIDGKCMGLGPTRAAKKHGYTKQRFFQVLHDYVEGGIEALKDKKKGPQRKYVRTEVIENQIIRYRFLDPDANSKVIAQKLRQIGYNVSQRSIERTITEKGLQKKLHLLNPQKEVKPVKVHVTKRRTESRPADIESIERGVRELLAQKVSGTLLGTWLLIPEHLRIGSWDLLKSWTGDNSSGIEPRLALQMVHESSLCATGIRQTRSLCHQGFELANGLPYIATDEEIHYLLNEHSVDEAKKLQIKLALLRQSLGHYKNDVLAFDPHRIRTYSRRIMPKKKSRPNERSCPVLQTFFSLDVHTGQPLGFTIGSSGRTATGASLELLEMMDIILPSNNVLLLADTEHESCRLIDHIIESDRYDILMPAARKKTVMDTIKNLEYKRHWAGYATSETQYRYQKSKHEFRLIGQRSGEKEEEYNYKPFIATGDKFSLELITEDYPERWTIEEFFNFEGAMGWNRASTMNLNIRYGKLSLALIAQAANYQLKKKLPEPYRKWTAKHLADSILRGIDGDLRVKDDTIIATLYNVPESLNLKQHYEDLPNKLERQGVNPKIPWLFDFKLDFRFK